MVHRADVSSSVMQDKVCMTPQTMGGAAAVLTHLPHATCFTLTTLPQMKSLEEERLRALEAAARARAEVQELSESRRKLQWQSKLLEKMSEVCDKNHQGGNPASARKTSIQLIPKERPNSDLPHSS